MKLIQKAVIKKGNEYLIGLRAPGAAYFPLHWDLPGGKLEPNEDPFTGITREVKEETNLDIKPIEVLGVYEFDLDGIDKPSHRFTIYSTEVIGGDLKLSPEHLEQRWTTKDEIMKLPIEPYFKPFFQDNP